MLTGSLVTYLCLRLFHSNTKLLGCVIAGHAITVDISVARLRTVVKWRLDLNWLLLSIC